MTERAKKLLLLYYEQSKKNRTIQGSPPLTFKGKEKDLKNYRIYGNTVNGESVGDRTGNLFDGTFIHRSVIEAEVSDNDPNRRSIVVDISNFNNGDKITFSRETSAGNMFQMYQVSSPLKRGRLLNSNIISGNSKTLLATITLDDISNYHYLMIFLNGSSNIITDEELLASKIIVNVGNTPLPYEAYGYKVPVTVEGKNLCNNIWEQKAINVETGNASPNENTVCCDFIPVKPNVTYSCSRTIANNYNNLRCYGTNKNYLGTGADLANKANPLKQGELFGTFMITDARVSYIRFNDLSNSLDTKYMLVEGIYTAETMPPYEPVATNLYLPEPIKMVGDEAEYIDYAEQKQHRVRKNLLQNTATSQTINGITFTVNADKSITCNGTATNTIYFAVKNNVVLESGTYVLTGCPLGGGKNTFKLYAQTAFGAKFYVDEGAGAIINYESKITIYITILSGYTCNNLTFYPMIRKADIEDDTYEPYIEDTELDVTLPVLPTLSGTNTLTVGTEVQPSGVEIKGRIKAAGGD